jgi:hypothetical protein
MTGRFLPIAASFLGLVVLLGYWQNVSFPASLSKFLGHKPGPAMALSSLTLSLSQVAASPPTIAVTLRNTSPNTHFTVLTWDTPFDPKAVALGIFRVKDTATGGELPTLDLKINRQLPPARDALVELAPGKEVSQEVKFEEPFMKLEKGKQYSVRAVGRWKGVWPVATGQLQDDDLAALGGGSRCLTGDFESKEVNISVQ